MYLVINFLSRTYPQKVIVIFSGLASVEASLFLYLICKFNISWANRKILERKKNPPMEKTSELLKTVLVVSSDFQSFLQMLYYIKEKGK